MKKLILALLLFVSAGAFAQDEPMLVDKIVGIVGDKVILLSDIELQYQQMKMEQPDVPEDFKCQIMDQMLTNKMYLEQALLDSIRVSDDEIESELDRRIRYFIGMIGSQEKLEAYYEKTIVEIKDEFRSDIRDQLLAQREQSKIYENIKVTPAEVKEFFYSIPKDSLPYFNAEMEVGQIVIKPKISAMALQLAQEKIDGIREQIVKGERDFGTMAQLYSCDLASAEVGGDLGFIGRGEMVTEFEAAAYTLQDSLEVSPVVKSQFGYHIIQLLSKKGQRIHVRHILICANVTSFDLKDAKAKIDSIKALIDAKTITFEKAVNDYSEDDATKYQGGMLSNPVTGTTYFEASQLDKDVYFVIDKMKPGEISQPQQFALSPKDQAYRIILLKSESTPHAANLNDDFYKIKAAALNKKQEEALHKWLTERIKSSYTLIDTHYLGCDLLKKWDKTGVIIESTYE